MNMIDAAINITLGSLLLFMGRKLFWLSSGILGFLMGVEYAAFLAPETNGLAVVIFAVLFGILGIVLGIGFQWLRVILIGFFGGGYFLMNIFPSMTSWGWLVAGGIIGMFMAIVAFDRALIILSSLWGSMLIVQSMNMDELSRNILFISAVVIGIFVQSIGIGTSYKEERNLSVEN